MGTALNVLLIEDSSLDASLLIHELRRGGFDLHHRRVEGAADMQAALAAERWDVVIADSTLPQFSAEAALEVLQASGLDLPFLIVSGTLDEDAAVRVLKAGAHDYLRKDNLKRLIPAVEREMNDARVRQQHRAAQDRLWHLAFFDPLTGLPNRHNLVDRLEKLVCSDGDESVPLALLRIDINQFREIKNTLGHQGADAVLMEVGKRLGQTIREPRFVARLDGDEFAVIVPRVASHVEAAAAARDIQGCLQAPVLIDELPIAVEVSIGAVFHPEHGSDPETLLQRADVALYSAKAADAGLVVYHNTAGQDGAVRLARMAELRLAVTRDELLLHYQPIIRLRDGAVAGAEALLRWNHPRQGMVAPHEFIGAAERTGVIRPVTEWVLRAAVQQHASWQQLGLDLPVSVNLSARNLLDPKLPDRVRRELCEHSLTAAAIAIEITESAIMSDIGRAVDVLFELHDIGLKISIDDFGVGYSSLSYLQRLPVDRLKVDRSFVMSMDRKPADATIVRSTIELAHNLGLEVVAEGVVTRQQYERLCEWGCDAVQGYYVSAPLDAGTFSKWMEIDRCPKRAF
jgi:diguanylate cyclase (GGDEF)-like protein